MSESLCELDTDLSGWDARQGRVGAFLWFAVKPVYFGIIINALGSFVKFFFGAESNNWRD